MGIHSLAVVDKAAKIGEKVDIGPFTTIYGDVVIGEGTWIGPNVTIMDGARIGKNCRIFPGSVISSIPQDLKYRGENTTAEIGDNTTVREYVTVNRGTTDKMKTVVGSNCLIMAYVHVAHDCIIGNNCILANGVQMAGHIQVDDWAIIGGTTAMHQFVRVGSHSIISGASKVKKDVPPFTKAGRDPLAYCGLNLVGLKRRGFTDQQIHNIHEVYRTLYLKGLNTSQAIEKIAADLPDTEEVRTIVEFVTASTRGILKGPSLGGSKGSEEEEED